MALLVDQQAACRVHQSFCDAAAADDDADDGKDEEMTSLSS